MMYGAPEVLQKMLALRVIVEEDETGGFVGEVPALPGCVSQGETLEELKTNIRDAIELWLAAANEAADENCQEHSHFDLPLALA